MSRSGCLEMGSVAGYHQFSLFLRTVRIALIHIVQAEETVVSYKDASA
jgi:hypothetical protein